MATIETLFNIGLGGFLAGAGYYIYSKNLIPISLDGDTVDNPPPAGDDTNDNPAVGEYAYFYKRKIQCRDNHLTAAYLRGQHVGVVNYKIYNDMQIYPAVCGGPGPLVILVAIATTDVSSGPILRSLGFVEYSGPPPQLNPNVPIPTPPNPLQGNRAYAYVGRRRFN